jgi:steroid delta-isomerase-like uncharacterized protein
MSVETNKAVLRRLLEEATNGGNLDLYDELCDPNYIFHDATTPMRGVEALKQTTRMFRDAFPDLHVTIEDLIGEGEMVVMRWTLRGTHRGTWMGMPPTNMEIAMTGVSISRFADGKQAETWQSQDTLGMLQQLGFLPALERALGDSA